MLKWFLGMEVIYGDDGSISLNQAHYIHKVLERFGMSDCNAASTPMCPSSILAPCEILEQTNPITGEETINIDYRAAVGSLMYATRTRIDIMGSLNILAQYSHNPHPLHYTYLKRMLRYLKGSVNKGICFQRTGEFVMDMYCDSNYAGTDGGDSKSRSCWIATVNGGPISASVKKQSRVAGASTEAEFICLAKAVPEIIYLRQVAEEMGAPQLKPTLLYEDNRACRIIAMNPFCENRSKAYTVEPALSAEELEIVEQHSGAKLQLMAKKAKRVNINLVKDEVQNQKTVAVTDISTTDNIADIGTKALGAERLQYLMKKIMVDVKPACLS